MNNITLVWQQITTVKGFMTWAHGAKLKQVVIYCCILTLENVGTMGNVRDVIAPNIAKRPQPLFIFIILMYLCNLSPSHQNSFSWRCNLYIIILDYPKIVSRSPMAVLQWTPTLFSATLPLSHTLSLSLSLCLSGNQPVSPSFHSSINMMFLRITDY